MSSLDDLPDVAEWDPSPEEEADLRERLLRAGEARAGTAPTTGGLDEGAPGAEPVEEDGTGPVAEGLTPVADADAAAETPAAEPPDPSPASFGDAPGSPPSGDAPPA